MASPEAEKEGGKKYLPLHIGTHACPKATLPIIQCLNFSISPLLHLPRSMPIPYPWPAVPMPIFFLGMPPPTNSRNSAKVGTKIEKEEKKEKKVVLCHKRKHFLQDFPPSLSQTRQFSSQLESSLLPHFCILLPMMIITCIYSTTYEYLLRSTGSALSLRSHCAIFWGGRFFGI